MQRSPTDRACTGWRNQFRHSGEPSCREVSAPSSSACRADWIFAWMIRSRLARTSEDRRHTNFNGRFDKEELPALYGLCMSAQRIHNWSLSHAIAVGPYAAWAWRLLVPSARHLLRGFWGSGVGWTMHAKSIFCGASFKNCLGCGVCGVLATGFVQEQSSAKLALAALDLQ